MGDRAPKAQRNQQGDARGGTARIGKQGREKIKGASKTSAAKLANKKTGRTKAAPEPAKAKVGKKQLPKIGKKRR